MVVRMFFCILIQAAICLICFCGCKANESWYYSNPELEISVHNGSIINIKTVSRSNCRKNIYFPSMWVKVNDEVIAISSSYTMIEMSEYLAKNHIRFHVFEEKDKIYLETTWGYSKLKLNYLFVNNILHGFALDDFATTQVPIQVATKEKFSNMTCVKKYTWEDEFEEFYLKTIDYASDGQKIYTYSFMPTLNVDLKGDQLFSIGITLDDDKQNCFFIPLYIEYDSAMLKFDKNITKDKLKRFFKENGFVITENFGTWLHVLYSKDGETKISSLATQNDPYKGSFEILFAGEKIYSFKYYVPSASSNNVKLGVTQEKMFKFPINKNTIKTIWGRSPMVFDWYTQ